MRRNGFRRVGLGLLAGAGALALSALTTQGPAVADTADPTAAPSFPFGGPPGDPYACMAEDVFGCAIVFGGSGIPIPHQNYIDAVNERYIQPDHPGFTPQALFTPEGLQPFTGVKDLPLDKSMAEGLTLLDAALKQQLDAGHDVVLYGYSQSASIDTLEERNLLDLPADERPDPDQLSFVLLGNPNAPNGGLLSRFDHPALQDADGNGPTIPSLGVTFNGATPDDIYPTENYTLEYDGFADFPRYPINLLADLNAIAGIQYVHSQYPMLTDEQLDDATLLPGSTDYTGALPDGAEAAEATNYWMVSTDTLPLLAPVQSIPVLGQPLYDLLEPDLRILVNLGYGSIDHGWDAGPANVPTAFDLFPTDLDWGDVLTALGDGAQKGIHDFIDDLGSLSLPGASDVGADGAAFTLDSLPSFTDIVNAFSGAASAAYAVLLPTADIANALLTTLPANSVQIFLSELGQGNLLDAVGLPIAASVGLTSLGAGFELISIENALAEISAELSSVFS
jgi:hypothetical protein